MKKVVYQCDNCEDDTCEMVGYRIGGMAGYPFVRELATDAPRHICVNCLRAFAQLARDAVVQMDKAG